MSVVALTGGSGFLGTHLALALTDAGHDVRVLDRMAPSEPVAGVEYLTGDVRDREAVSRLVVGSHAVVHAAFASPRADLATIEAVNAGGTRALLDTSDAARVRRLVLVSHSRTGARSPRASTARALCDAYDFYCARGRG